MLGLNSSHFKHGIPLGNCEDVKLVNGMSCRPAGLSTVNDGFKYVGKCSGLLDFEKSSENSRTQNSTRKS